MEFLKRDDRRADVAFPPESQRLDIHQGFNISWNQNCNACNVKETFFVLSHHCALIWFTDRNRL